VQEGVKVKNGPHPQKFDPPFLENNRGDFSEIWCKVRGQYLPAIKEITRESVFKKNLRVEISDFGGWGANPKIKPPVSGCYGGISSPCRADCNEVLLDPYG